MKSILILLLVIFVSACERRPDHPVSTAVIGNPAAHLVLTQDSGFVTKKEGLPFLLANALTDTTDSFWDHVKNNDTIGKYYKLRESGRYYYCTIDLSSKYTFETHLLMELSSTGAIIKSERYFHGNYSSCWDTRYERFNKFGDYYGIVTCGTGSGFSASYLFLFKEILPQDQQNSITQQRWSSPDGGKWLQNINSEMEWKNDVLVLHYTIEDGELDENYIFRVQKTKKIDVQYRFINNKWESQDTTTVQRLRNDERL